MKPEAQRIAIAEARGWTHYHADLWVPPIVTGDPYFSELQCDAIPGYLTDLNAMQEAVATLKPAQRHAYLCALEQVLGLSIGPGGWDMDERSLWAIVNATAAQRAEAFLRTIGKWDDSE